MIEQSGVLREWNKRYLFEYLVALAFCLASASFCIPLARAAATNASRLLWLAPPAASILLMALVVYRHFLRIDEFPRRVMLESFAVAGAIVSIWTLVYVLLEIAGFPRISMWWVWGSLMFVWNVWTLGKWAVGKRTFGKRTFQQ
jgi:hypothetical protein